MCVVCVQAYSQTYLLDSNSRKRGWEELSSLARTKKGDQERLRLGTKEDRSSLEKHSGSVASCRPLDGMEALKSDLPEEGLYTPTSFPSYSTRLIFPSLPQRWEMAFRRLETQTPFISK